ncbi:MAG: flagellin [Betaproteobacteria bacterium]|nr:flagellin [Betaproteobacteria bacterium]
MPIYVNTNIASLIAQNNLSNSQASLQTSLQRLSSGLRINSAADDPAGLAVATDMTSVINGDNQAINNANNGISMAQTAGGALQQLVNNLQTVRTLAVEAANGTYTDTQRSQLQAEVDQLTQENSQIIQTTNFNGVALFSASTTLTFQIGASGVTSNQVALSSTVLTGLASYASSLTATGTINISSSAAASAALSALDGDINTVVTNESTWGAVQNRFQTAVANLTNYVQNLTAAQGQIMDANFAAETANLTKNQVLQQAGTAILAQANALPQLALTLLR